MPKPLFELNPVVNRAALAAHYRADARVQVRDVLTPETAITLRTILTRETPWGLAWQAGRRGPFSVDQHGLNAMPAADRQQIGQSLANAARDGEYAFQYAQYAMLTGYQERWNPGCPHDLIIEHLNAEPFLEFTREITGMRTIVKAEAQATLFAPEHFLSMHDDRSEAEGRLVAYVLNLTAPDWRPEWGGYLEFFDESEDVIAGWKPRFNSLNLFTVPQRHQVGYVPPFAPLGRLAITGWLRDR